MLDLRSVTNELSSVKAKWHIIGVQLGVDSAKLEEIESNHPTADRRFSEVIKFWLRGNASAAVSWESLVEVLERPSVCEKGLATTLREKGGMIVSEAVGVAPGSGAAESGVQPQENNGGQRGKKRSVEQKLDDSGDQHHEHQGAYASNIIFVYCCTIILIMYVDNNAGGPEAKKAKLATGTGYVAAKKISGRF